MSDKVSALHAAQQLYGTSARPSKPDADLNETLTALAANGTAQYYAMPRQIQPSAVAASKSANLVKIAYDDAPPPPPSAKSIPVPEIRQPLVAPPAPKTATQTSVAAVTAVAAAASAKSASVTAEKTLKRKVDDDDYDIKTDYGDDDDKVDTANGDGGVAGDDSEYESGEYEDDGDDDDDDGEDDDDNKGEKQARGIAGKIDSLGRQARPTTLVDPVGSASGDNSVDDGVDADADIDDKVAAAPVAELTPAEFLIGKKGMEKIAVTLQRLMGNWPELLGAWKESRSMPLSFIDSLNKFVLNLVTPKNPQMAAEMQGYVGDSEKSTAAAAARMVLLRQINKRMNDVDEQTGEYCVPANEYAPLALACAFGLVRSCIVRAHDPNTIVCAITLDPFRDNFIAPFVSTGAAYGLWEPNNKMAPIVEPRYAVFLGPTLLEPSVAVAATATATATAAATADVTSESVPPKTTPVASTTTTATAAAAGAAAVQTSAGGGGGAKAEWTETHMENGRVVVRVSSKRLFVHDITKHLENSKVDLVLLPDGVLEAQFARRVERGRKSVTQITKRCEDNPAFFVHYLNVARLPRTEENDAKLAAYLQTTTIIAQGRAGEATFYFAYMLFGFLRMQANLVGADANALSYVDRSIEVQTVDRVLQTPKRAGLVLHANELPVGVFLNLNSSILALLKKLWLEYTGDLGLANKPGKPTSAEYCAARQAACERRPQIAQCIEFVLDRSGTAKPVDHEQAFARDMLDTAVDVLFTSRL